MKLPKPPAESDDALDYIVAVLGRGQRDGWRGSEAYRSEMESLLQLIQAKIRDGTPAEWILAGLQWKPIGYTGVMARVSSVTEPRRSGRYRIETSEGSLFDATVHLVDHDSSPRATVFALHLAGGEESIPEALLYLLRGDGAPYGRGGRSTLPLLGRPLAFDIDRGWRSAPVIEIESVS